MRIPSVCSKSWFLMGILFVVSFGVGLFFYREFYRPVLDDPFVMEREVQRSIPPWIEIKNAGGKKFLKDNQNFFEIELEKNLEILFFNSTTISLGKPNKKEHERLEGIEIERHVYDNITKQDEWIKFWIKNSNCSFCYNEIKKISNNLYEVPDSASLGEIINYFSFQKKYIYQITVFDSTKDINEILSKIIFF